MTFQGQRTDMKTISIVGMKLPWKTAVVIVLSTTLLLVDYYYPLYRTLPELPFGNHWTLRVATEHLGIYFIAPLLAILLMRDRPRDYGITFGDWKAGIKWTLISWGIAAPILFFAGRTPEMIDYYHSGYNLPVLQVALTALLEIFSWEFFFRGFLTFALIRVAGPTGVLLASVPFALMHMGKPPLETFSTIFGGTAFGWVAWRTNSFIYSWLIHWFVMTFTIIVALLSYSS